MNKYLLIYRFPAEREYEASAEEMKPMYAQWEAWKNQFKAQIVDMGDGLKPTGKVLKQGAVIDVPHMESKEIIGGYSVVQAESYEHAVTVARACPVTGQMRGAYIEIREMEGFG